MAHESGPLHPDDLARAWQVEPCAGALLVLSAALYVRGARRPRGVTTTQSACFWSGLAMLALALFSPLHPLGEVLFSAHMAQHEILMLVAAPLLVLSRPMVPMLWGLPLGARRAAGHYSRTAIFQRCWRGLTKPFTAWWIHLVALWAWHAPALFTATLRSEWIHTAQHLSFFLSALLFWWALFHVSGKTAYGSGVLYIFTTALHSGVLGALLTFAPVVIYPAYSSTAPLWGLTALEDQQIGGLIMWVPAGVVYMAAGLALFAAWLRNGAVTADGRRYAD